MKDKFDPRCYEQRVSLGFVVIGFRFFFFLLSKVVQVIFYIHALSRMIHRFDNDPTDLEIDRDRSFRSSYSKIKDERCHRYIVFIEYYFFTFSDFCLTPS